MRPTHSLVCRVGGRVLLSLAIASPLAAADAPLFPQPLHLVRRVEDPIANRTSEVDEFCVANEIITIDGFKTVVVSYDREEVLEIDRAASTYSVARFEEIAAVNALTRPPAQKSTTRATTTALGVSTSLAGRSADAFSIVADEVTIDLRVDRVISVSRKAFDALTGANDPNENDARHDAIARAAMRPSISSAVAEASYGLPLELSITFDAGRGTHLTIRNAIVRMDSESPPAELLSIPAGSKLVPSRAAKLRKSLEDLKDPPPHP